MSENDIERIGEIIVDYPDFIERMVTGQYFPENVPHVLLHAALGLVDEAAEFAGPIKKAFAYGKSIDYVNLDEEIGDLLWFIQLYANFRDKTLDQFIEQNRAKLIARYGEKWNQEDALNRDLVKEREVLEREQPLFQSRIEQKPLFGLDE